MILLFSDGTHCNLITAGRSYTPSIISIINWRRFATTQKTENTMGTKTHDRETFCKHVTADVAVIILSSLSVRWSSPLLFNDPFDCSHRFDYGFDLRDAKEHFVNECVNIVFGKDSVNGDRNHPLFILLSYMRSANDGRISEEELRAEMALGYEESCAAMTKTLTGFSAHWDELMRSHRVFCLTEEHDNILMWAHYSDLHKGAVIQLKCIEKLDNPICASTKVVYSDYFPSIIQGVDDFVKINTGQKIFDQKDLYTRFICTKSNHWAYEKEWRLVYPRDNKNTELFEYSKLWPQEIDAVYLGCRMSESHKDTILKLLEGELNHVRVFQGRKDSNRYALNFEQIK